MRMAVGARPRLAPLLVLAVLLFVGTVNIFVYPDRHIPVIYVVPLLIAALTLSSRGVLITAIAAFAINLVSMAVEGTPPAVWPVTAFALSRLLRRLHARTPARRDAPANGRAGDRHKSAHQPGPSGRGRAPNLGLEDLLRVLLDRVRDALAGDTATVLLLTADGERLAVRAASGIIARRCVGRRLSASPGRGAAGRPLTRLHRR